MNYASLVFVMPSGIVWGNARTNFSLVMNAVEELVCFPGTPRLWACFVVVLVCTGWVYIYHIHPFIPQNVNEEMTGKLDLSIKIKR